ncbi:MAG: lipoprotein insertase outer membrane protein LolB [Pseudomonadota bacterium]
MRLLRSAAAVAAALVLLSGCAHSSRTEPVTADDPSVNPLAPTDDARLRALADSFDAIGRLGAAVDGKGYNARLRWIQQGTTFNIFLSGPVGIGQTEVLGHPGLASIRQQNNEQTFDDPGDALSAALGFEAPLSELRFWALGVPAPGPGFIEYEAPDSAVRRFEQSGWEVLVRDLSDTPAGPLPRRVTLTRDGTRLKLVLNRWESPTAAPVSAPARPVELMPRAALGMR